MSEHTNKERRHKEATLLDVTSIVPGPPSKPTKKPVDGQTCLSLNFSRGGSVDFMFKTPEQRNLWLVTLSAIIKQNETLRNT